MNNKSICATLLALGCIAAPAMAENVAFTYTGFFDEQASMFRPDAQLTGSFSGIDKNNDRVLDLSEITAWKVADIDYLDCAGAPYYSCDTMAFSYSLDKKQLNFSVFFHGSDPDGFMSTGRAIDSGVTDYSYQRWGGDSTEHTLSWTADTKFALTVPEPETYLMLLAGLGLTAALARRRKTA
ncbi:hypothetical protein CSQ96_09475 [Janthinobacterium sp. BJB412]|nr:hypothetical protein CSQ96_09475 [Janthinobacterium sp. BJB412]